MLNNVFVKKKTKKKNSDCDWEMTQSETINCQKERWQGYSQLTHNVNVTFAHGPKMVRSDLTF